MLATQTQFNDNMMSSRLPFVFQIGKEFATFQETLNYITDPGNDGIIKGTLSDFNTKLSEITPEIYMRANVSTTRIGGNDAINCYPQFCRNDDIIHPVTGFNGSTFDGLGRVYSEVYDMPQQLLHMTFGCPQHGDLLSFYTDAIKTNVADLVNKGEQSTTRVLSELIGKLAVGAAVVGLAINIPAIPLLYMAKKAAEIIDTDRVTKYYDFRATMPLYYRYVNSILAHIAVNLGLIPNGPGGQTAGQMNETYKNLYSNDGANPEGIPSILREGCDIYRILATRDKYLGTDRGNVSSEDYLLGDEDSKKTGWFDTFFSRIDSSMHGADKFVGFRIEKSVDSSESFSNNVGESSVAGMLNSKSLSMKDLAFSAMGGKVADIPGLGVVGDALQGLLQGASSVLGVVGTGAGIMTGQGLVDIPKVWQGSSFSKSYNFSMTFKALEGSPLSVFQDIALPLSMLLAGAMPRSVGENGYTQPFLVRAYSKGIFAVPLGMITSLTIKRGAQEFGWNNSMLPTQVEVSFTIEDLAPVMHMALMDGAAEFMKIFGANSAFQEYLLTLSGMGLNERLVWTQKLFRKLAVSLRIARSTYGNPLYWATGIGNSTIPRLIAAFTPYTRYGNK